MIRRYLFPFYFNSFIVALFFAGGILLVARLADVFDDLLASKAPASFAWLYLVSLVPGYVHFALPLAAFFSGVLHAARYRQSNEYTAIWSSGHSLVRPLVYVWVWLFLVLMLCVYLQEFVLPVSKSGGKYYLNEILGKSNDARQTFQSNLLLGHGATTLFIQKHWAREGRGEGILLSTRTTKALSYALCADLRVSQQAAMLFYCGKSSGLSREGLLRSESTNIELRETGLLRALQYVPVPKEEATIPRLLSDREVLTLRGTATFPISVEIWARIHFPLSILISAVLGFLIGVRFSAAGIASVFAATFLYTLIFYAMIYSLRTVGDAGFLPPPLAAGLPNLVLISGFGALWYRQRI